MVRSFVDRAVRTGGSLLLFGEPGVGKTVLDAAAADLIRQAAARG
ncbi:hypothetical protein GCM10023322_83270 [Rugosimonospora acidiphila]|uniref:Uncharacterized protein n=1 Tax=Rugosimonospora acidiphila TaxID=556531 RepID=A0ABP9STK0_9ACTN